MNMIDYTERMMQCDKNVRKCPLCKRKITFSGFFNENYGLLGYKCIDLWDNENVLIPCCWCYKIMYFIRRYSLYEIIISSEEKYYKAEYSIHNILTIKMNSKMYDKLEKWGFIKE